MLQAVAAMLMVWHHLFGFPERITVPYVLILDRLFPVETYLAYFGRICIAIFAFSSGYGLRKRYLNSTKKIGIIQNYKSSLLQLLKFYSRYWVVFFAFIPLGFVLKVYNFDWLQFLKSLLGIDSGYYFFQKLTFFPRYSWLIFLWCLALSIVTGMVLEGIAGLIEKTKPYKH